MNVRGVLSVAVVGLSAVAVAQGPSVAPFPLAVKRAPADFTKKNEEALQAELRKVVRDVGAQVPNSFVLSTALGDLKRQDCDVENMCLAALAMRADALYGLYVSVDFDVLKTVSVAGRVVRSDGQPMGAPKSVSLPLGKDTFAAVTKVLMTRLLKEELRLAELPSVRPATVAVEPAVDAGVVTSVAPVDAGVVAELPPPPMPPALESPLRPAGIVTSSVGGAALVTGIILFIAGRAAAATELRSDGVLLPSGDGAKARGAMTSQQLGLGFVFGGVGALVGGLVMFLLSPDQTPAVFRPWLSPREAGAVVGISGEIP